MTLYLFLTGEFVAQFKFTVLLMNNGPLKITGGPLDPEVFDTSHSLQDEELKVNYADVLSKDSVIEI